MARYLGLPAVGGDSFHPVSFQLLGEALRLAKVSREPVYAVGIGQGIHNGAWQLEGCGAKKAILVDTQEIYQSESYGELLASYIQTLRPGTVLVGGTMEGRAMAPRLAVRFRTGLTADCTSLEMEESGNLIQVRPAFGRKSDGEDRHGVGQASVCHGTSGVMERESSQTEATEIILDRVAVQGRMRFHRRSD